MLCRDSTVSIEGFDFYRIKHEVSLPNKALVSSTGERRLTYTSNERMCFYHAILLGSQFSILCIKRPGP